MLVPSSGYALLGILVGELAAGDLVGDAGLTDDGLVGEDGLVGDDGLVGEEGLVGDVGLVGEEGLVGEADLVGETGDLEGDLESSVNDLGPFSVVGDFEEDSFGAALDGVDDSILRDSGGGDLELGDLVVDSNVGDFVEDSTDGDF